MSDDIDINFHQSEFLDIKLFSVSWEINDEY